MTDSLPQFRLRQATAYHFFSLRNKALDVGQDPDLPQESKPASPTDKSGMISYDEVKLHNSASSCWIIINGYIYDVTQLLETHPGGRQVVLKVAGTDAT